MLGRFVVVFEITHERFLVASRAHYSFEEEKTVEIQSSPRSKEFQRVR